VHRFPAPGSTLAPASVRPFRCSFLCPCSKMRLSERSSPGVRPSFTVCPAIPAPDLSVESTSPGVSFPFNARGEESPRPVPFGLGLPGGAGGFATVPIPPLRCRSQVFPTSQRLLPLSAVPPFSDGWRSWGSPYRGLFLPRSSDGSSPPACPLDVSPSGCAVPVPRRGRPMARWSFS